MRNSVGGSGGGYGSRITPGGPVVSPQSETYQDTSQADYHDYNTNTVGSSGSSRSRHRKSHLKKSGDNGDQPLSARRRNDASRYAENYAQQGQDRNQEQEEERKRQEQERKRQDQERKRQDQERKRQLEQQRQAQQQQQQQQQPFQNEDGPDPYAEPEHLEPCPDCGRKFRPATLAKHIRLKICQKKRKAYKVKRVAEKVKLSSKQKQKYEEAAKKKKEIPKWKRDRDALRDAMKQGKMVATAIKEGRDLRTLPPPTTTQYDDRTPCPHCGRKFNAKAAERHIPRCKNIKAKPKRLVRNTSSSYGMRRGSKR